MKLYVATMLGITIGIAAAVFIAARELEDAAPEPSPPSNPTTGA